MEQRIGRGKVNIRESVTSGLANAVSGAIYGNHSLKSAKDALVRGAGAGAATAAINHLSNAWDSRRNIRQDNSWNPGSMAGGTGISPHMTKRDPKAGCVTASPVKSSIGYSGGYGYQYKTPGGSQKGWNDNSIVSFGKDVLIGAVMGGLSSVTFYGADKALGSLKRSICGDKGGSDRYINGQRTSKHHELTDTEIESLKNDIRDIGADESIFRFNKGYQTGYSDKKGLIYVRGDVLPDVTSTHPRDLMSSKAVLAHEYYGHKNFGDLYGSRNPLPGAWNDEFRASYNAALNAPNLSEIDRMYLMSDALERAKVAGVNIKITDTIRKDFIWILKEL